MLATAQALEKMEINLRGFIVEHMPLAVESTVVYDSIQHLIEAAKVLHNEVENELKDHDSQTFLQIGAGI